MIQIRVTLTDDGAGSNTRSYQPGVVVIASVKRGSAESVEILYDPRKPK